MEPKNIPNVLPDGALKPIGYSDFVIAKLNNDAKARSKSLDDKVANKPDSEV